jgi:molybdopterin molybdotransferase
MKTVAEAQALILEQTGQLAAVQLPAADALGLVLAEAVVSDIDSPPHDKSVVDGYAVCAEDFAAGGTTVRLRILEEVTAGQVPTLALAPGNATRIMTGAPIPNNTAAVVMIERTTADETHVSITEPRFSPGMNITRRATSLQKDAVVLQPGSLLRGIELGLLAEVGRAFVNVFPQPKVAVLATGNELVPVEQTPAAGQIRNSNGPMLAGLVRQAGGEAIVLGVALDTVESLREKITAGLETSDILLLSGGVSAGVLDLVPATLQDAGVSEVFHKVNLKPGKPLWFGIRSKSGRTQLVFGLPGNPVSSLVCFELFVRPAIAKMLGQTDVLPPTSSATLTAEHRVRGERVTYWPARLSANNRVTPLPWQGSGDLRTLSDANALLVFPTEGLYEQGAVVDVIRL